MNEHKQNVDLLSATCDGVREQIDPLVEHSNLLSLLFQCLKVKIETNISKQTNINKSNTHTTNIHTHTHTHNTTQHNTTQHNTTQTGKTY